MARLFISGFCTIIQNFTTYQPTPDPFSESSVAASPGSAVAQSKFKWKSADVEEILSYECARSIVKLVAADEQLGPLFSLGKLIFTSLEASDGSKLLLINAGSGNFSLKLENDGLNRIYFEIPTASQNSPRKFFLTYLHSDNFHSRYFDFGEDAPPASRDELEYTLVNPQRASYLLAHLDYAIKQTAEATLYAITEGKLQRHQFSRHQFSSKKVDTCDHIARERPQLARTLKYKLDQIDLIIDGPAFAKTTAGSPASRSPASVFGK